MTTETIESAGATALGNYLRSARNGLGMTLRGVEEATEEISNAYLSQLENGKIKKPSPHILYTLATIYGVSYENLMERAGYITPSNPARGDRQKHGRAATFAIENLSATEEQELLKYLSYYRSSRKGT